jgi:hypothetical protein
MKALSRIPILASLGIVALAAGSALHAQLPQASATSLALGFNRTASATGFAAVANNPAGLALGSSPGFSMALPAVSLLGGMGPVGMGDIADWEGRLVPAEVKDGWLQSIIDAGSQSGPAEVGVTPLAMSIGPVGLQLSSVARGVLSLNPDAAELLLYGNAGRTGEPRDFQLEGSRLDGFAISTIALSYGFRATPRLSLGVTGKYSVGHGLAVGRDLGSTLTADPVSVELAFPAILNSSEDAGFDMGSGIGLDLGAIWEADGFRVGATIQNVLSTFQWSLDRFSYIPGTMFFEQGSSADDFEEQPAEAAPRNMRDAVEDLTPGPVFSVGAELTDIPDWRIMADIRTRTSGRLALGPDFHAGVGAEFQGLSFLPLRGHAAVVSGGVQLGGGLSVIVGPLHLSGAAAVRTGDVANATLVGVTVSFGTN